MDIHFNTNIVFDIKIIGVDGGFDNSESEYEETLTIVILPDYVTLPFPSVELPEKVVIAFFILFFLRKESQTRA